MPQMNGAELARQIVQRRPEAGVSYLTGFDRAALAASQVTLDPWPLLRKPVLLDTLARSVGAGVAHGRRVRRFTGQLARAIEPPGLTGAARRSPAPPLPNRP